MKVTVSEPCDVIRVSILQLQLVLLICSFAFLIPELTRRRWHRFFPVLSCSRTELSLYDLPNYLNSMVFLTRKEHNIIDEDLYLENYDLILLHSAIFYTMKCISITAYIALGFSLNDVWWQLCSLFSRLCEKIQTLLILHVVWKYIAHAFAWRLTPHSLDKCCILPHRTQRLEWLYMTNVTILPRVA